jgi:hypothetical protein
MRNGIGILSWASGDLYYGVWKDDMKNGKGIFSNLNG